MPQQKEVRATWVVASVSSSKKSPTALWVALLHATHKFVLVIKFLRNP